MNVTNETMALAHEILAYWLRFNNHKQSEWVGYVSRGESLISTAQVGGREVNVCNTSMCAAGTAVFLSYEPEEFKAIRDDFGYFDWIKTGGRLLGLTDSEAALVFTSDEKSAKRYMIAIAAGSQKKFDRATEKRRYLKDVD